MGRKAPCLGLFERGRRRRARPQMLCHGGEKGGGKGIGRHTEPPVSCESREKLAGWWGGGWEGRDSFFPPEREKGGKKR